MKPNEKSPKSNLNPNTEKIEGQSTHPRVVGAPDALDLPVEFGRYRLTKLLGQGGMGAVYLAHDTELDRDVALKLPHFTGQRTKDLSDRFRREARLAATLNHPNICRILDINEFQGQLYLTMEFVEGKSLNDVIKGKGGVDSRTAARLVSRLASAVHFAHSKGIIHRDLKPANIMIKKDREFVVMDFGLARRIEQEDVQLTATGAVLGTPAYMAPEQLRGENKSIGAQSDVYSLGVILYELLTGERPFQGTLPQIYAQVLSSDSVSPRTLKANVDPDLDAICQRATSSDQKQRYRTAEDFTKALNDYLSGQTQRPSNALDSLPSLAEMQVPMASFPAAAIKKPAMTKSKLPLIAIGSVVGLAVVVAMAALLFRGPSSSQAAKSNESLAEATDQGASPINSVGGEPKAEIKQSNVPVPSPASLEKAVVTNSPTADKESPAQDSSSPSNFAVRPTPDDYLRMPPGLIWSTKPSDTWWWCASISPRGDYLAAVEDLRSFSSPQSFEKRKDIPIRLWPIRNGQKGQDSFVLRQPLDRSFITGMTFSKDGSLLATSTFTGEIVLWDTNAATPKLLTKLQRFDGVITGLAFSPDGKYLASGKRGKGQPVIVWDLENAADPREVYSWDLPSEQATFSLMFSNNSQELYIGGGSDDVPSAFLYRWVFGTQKIANAVWSSPVEPDQQNQKARWIRAIAQSRDSNRVALAHNNDAYVIDATTGSLLQSFRKHTNSIKGISFVCDDTACVTSSYDQTLRLWRIENGEQVWQNPTPTGPNEGLAVSSDAKLAFTTSKSGLDSGNLAQLWRLPDDLKSAPKLSPSGTTTQQADLTALQGVWDIVSEEFNGANNKLDGIPNQNILRVRDNELEITRTFRDGKQGVFRGSAQFRMENGVKLFDWQGTDNNGKPITWLGMYDLTGDVMRLVYSFETSIAENPRPTAFTTKGAGAGTIFAVYRRRPRDGGSDHAWLELFNGKDLSGWKQVNSEGAWSVKDNIIVCTPGNGWLATEKDYSDFELELEYRLPPGGNSGVFLRTPATGDPSGKGLLEVQLLDETAPAFKDVKNSNRTGALLGLAEANMRADSRPDVWNKLTVLVVKSKMIVAINGQKISECNLNDLPRSIVPPDLQPAGRIALQRHRSQAEFRDIRIREIKE